MCRCISARCDCADSEICKIYEFCPTSIVAGSNKPISVAGRGGCYLTGTLLRIVHLGKLAHFLSVSLYTYCDICCEVLIATFQQMCGFNPLIIGFQHAPLPPPPTYLYGDRLTCCSWPVSRVVMDCM